MHAADSPNSQCISCQLECFLPPIQHRHTRSYLVPQLNSTTPLLALCGRLLLLLLDALECGSGRCPC